MRHISPRVVRQTVVTALLSVSIISHAAEWFSKDAGVSFALPSDPAWKQVKPPRGEAKLVLQKADGTATVFFAGFEKKHEEKDLNDKLVQGWEKGYFRKSNAVKLSGEFFDFKGKRAYKVTDEEISNGVKLRGVAILWLNDGMLFDIVAMKTDGDPMKDDAIKAFVESMTFLPKAAQ